MRKQMEESAAAEGARRATGAAAGRGRGGRIFGRVQARDAVLRLLRGEDLESVSRGIGDHGGAGLAVSAISFWPRARRAEEPRAGCPGRRPPSAAGQDRRAADGDRVAVREGGPPGGRRPFGLGGGRRDEGRPFDLHPSGVRRAAGSARVWERRGPASTRGVTRRSHARRGVAAGCRSVPPRTRCESATSAGCLKPRRFMARGTAKPGRSCGSRGSAPRRSGCGG